MLQALMEAVTVQHSSQTQGQRNSHRNTEVLGREFFEYLTAAILAGNSATLKGSLKTGILQLRRDQCWKYLSQAGMPIQASCFLNQVLVLMVHPPLSRQNLLGLNPPRLREDLGGRRQLRLSPGGQQDSQTGEHSQMQSSFTGERVSRSFQVSFRLLQSPGTSRAQWHYVNSSLHF